MMVTYWCLPSDEDSARYFAVIRALAGMMGTPVFQPHLTLGTLEHASPDIEKIVAALDGLVLQPSDIDSSDVFTKSLFVRFVSSAVLLTARRVMERLPGFRRGRTFDPHISLCYGPPPDGARALNSVKDLLAKPVRFDRLAAVNISLPVESHADVEAWTVAETHRTQP